VSAQGVIAILLTVIGFLVVSWVGVASMWVRDKFADHGELLDQHDDRLSELESNHAEAHGQRKEILQILRKEGGV